MITCCVPYIITLAKARAPMSSWQNKVAIVTGGSSGLGKAIARTLLEQGARVVIAARNAEKLQAVAAEFAALPGEVLSVSADITREDDVARLNAEATRRFSRLDLLVNCAG